MPISNNGPSALTLLRGRIGEMAAGEELPSLRTLSHELAVPLGAVREAMTELKRSGIVSYGRGRRSRVLPSFSGDSQTDRHIFRNRIIEASYRALSPAETQIADIFKRKKTLPCLVLARVRIVDDRPLAIHRAFINPDLIEEPDLFFVAHDLQVISLASIYRDLGFHPLGIPAVLKAGLIDAAEAKLLDLPQGAPVLRARQQTIVEHGGQPKVLEVLNATYIEEIEFSVVRVLGESLGD